MQFRDLREQHRRLKKEINSAVLDVLESGNYIGGKHVQDLERQLADFVGARNCITCANGTDALQLALMAWGAHEGLAVFVPDLTFFSSGEVVSSVGATPVFVDVDPRTFNMNPIKLEEAISSVKTNTDLVPFAVVAVDLFGLPADYPAIRDVCKKNGLHLLEDGAQGFGGSIKGSKACSFGDISTTSFFPAKPLGCYGDGGAVFTDDDDWAALIRSLAVHGKGEMKYDNVRVGMNSRLDTLQAAILQKKLRAFAGYELASVNRVAERYSEALADLASTSDIMLPFIPPGYTSSWAQYTIKLSQDLNRDLIRSKMQDAGIPTMIYYPKPMHSQRAFEGSSICFEGCPTTSLLCDSVLSLPMGPYVSEEDSNLVATTLNRIIRDSASNW